MSNILNFNCREFLSVIYLEILTPILKVGEALKFTLTLQNTGNYPVQAEIRYQITFLVKDSAPYTQSFMLANRTCPSGLLLFNQSQVLFPDELHPIASGKHLLSIFVNGRCLKTAEFYTTDAL